MTIESTQTSVTGNGDGVTTVFSLSPLKIYSSDDLKVYKVVSGVYTEILEGTTSTTYSLSLESVPGTGEVTYPASGGTPLAEGEDLVMAIDPIGTQEIDLQNQSAYNAETVEKALDIAALNTISNRGKFERSLKVPEGETVSDLPGASARANKFLAFDSLGNATASDINDASALIVSTFVETLLPNADANAVLTTLGFSSDAITFIGNAVSAMKTQLGLGTAADLDSGTSAGNVVVLDGSGKLPLSVMPTEVLNSEITGTVSFNIVTGIPYTQQYYNQGVLTIAHGLGSAPDMIPLVRCTCTDAGGDITYSQNDTVYLAPHTFSDYYNNSRGIVLDWDNTNIYWHSPKGKIIVNTKTTTSQQYLNLSKWKFDFMCLSF